MFVLPTREILNSVQLVEFFSNPSSSGGLRIQKLGSAHPREDKLKVKAMVLLDSMTCPWVVLVMLTHRSVPLAHLVRVLSPTQESLKSVPVISSGWQE